MVFDMADPGVKKMVDGWADNTEYEALVTVRTGSGPQRNVSEVTSFEPQEMLEEEETAAPSTAPPAKPKGKPEAGAGY